MSTWMAASGTIIAAVITLVVGYLLGIRRSRLERLQERRDNAIADIFGAMVQHSRDCITWADTGRDAEWEDNVSDSYEGFLRCYYTRSIWLNQATCDLLNAYAKAANRFYIRGRNEMDSAGRLPDGTKATKLLDEKLVPPLIAAEDRLRQELEFGRPGVALTGSRIQDIVNRSPGL